MNDVNPDTALLGAMLSGYAQFEEITERVAGVDFREPRDEMVFDAIVSVHASGVKVDPVTVRAALNAETIRSMPGGPTYLVDLMTNCPNPLEAMEYARQVRDNKQRRDLASAFQTGHEALRNLDQDPYSIGERATQQITAATVEGVATGLVEFGSVLPDVIDQAEAGHAAALTTPWSDLDRMIQGLAPGRLITIGARPGVGKSIMGTNLALDVAHRHKKPVVVCSVEMSKVEVGQRILAAYARVSLTALEHGQMTSQLWDQVAAKYADLEAMPLYIEDSGSQTLASIRSATKRAMKRGPVVAVIVDYLQLLTARDPRQPRHEQIGEISKGLKIMAREFDTCVIAMAQLNRASTLRRDGVPTLADLRESGSIEADSDIVVLLHRPDPNAFDVQALVPKNRSGPTGEFWLQLQGHYARFVQSTQPPQQWSASGQAS